MLVVLCAGCFDQPPPPEFYGRVIVPRNQELRWSDGGLPRIFDPAQAAAAPDTDAVRALYEGLTELDSRTLQAMPGVATHWQSAPDNLTWIFHLRRNARWSNDETVTAHDFVRSWQRAVNLGELAPHRSLLGIIEGVPKIKSSPDESSGEINNNDKQAKQNPPSVDKPNAGTRANAVDENIGVEAIDDFTLRVRLQQPDAHFPQLVAHTVFRPVHNQSITSIESLITKTNDKDNRVLAAQSIITNGAFRLGEQNQNEVILERAENYWDAKSVALKRVQFVNATNTEDALALYEAGKIDAVTNASIEPLAVKLLQPYKDFHQSVFAALNYYQFNSARAPFDDLRVRQALAFAINRERISSNTLGGAAVPAAEFIPCAGFQTVINDEKFSYNIDEARRLMRDAGYESGANFPIVRLLINRNEQHRAVAIAVQEMWRNALSINTEIIVKDWEDYDAAMSAGDYDVVRRSLVMQTPDDVTNMRLLFDENDVTNEKPLDVASQKHEKQKGEITNQHQALREMPAVPLYFATSYALVKPYVINFDRNLFDAPSLKHVRIAD